MIHICDGVCVYGTQYVHLKEGSRANRIIISIGFALIPYIGSFVLIELYAFKCFVDRTARTAHTLLSIYPFLLYVVSLLIQYRINISLRYTIYNLSPNPQKRRRTYFVTKRTQLGFGQQPKLLQQSIECKACLMNAD